MYRLPVASTEGNGGALVAAVAARFAEEDAVRMAELDTLVKGGGKCRYCGHTVSDARLVESPGLCTQRVCRRKALVDAAARAKEKVATAAVPTEPAVKPPSARPDSTTSPAPASDELEDAVLCKNCKKNELRVNNHSGWCTPCRKANGNRVPANGKGKLPSAGPGKPRRERRAETGLPAVEDLPDEFLVLCVKEARLRRDRIQAEAAERMQMLEKALAS